jgi:hypothetical protein
MSLTATGLRALRASAKVFVPLFPSLPTVPLFLVLYNNCFYGCLSLIGLIALNLIVVVMPRLGFAHPRAISWGSASSFCMIGGLAAILIIETLFPVMLPKEYASVLELSKDLTNPPSGQYANGPVLFDNLDQRLTGQHGDRHVVDGQLKQWHAPGREFAYYGWDPNARIQYVNLFLWNSLGYFDHDYKHHKEPGVHRIVVIGDSYVEAVQVPLSATFHKLLEASLNAATDQASVGKFEVMALGNSGTGQVYHQKVLKEQAIAYQPDTVIVSLCGNDFCDDDPQLKTEFLLSSRSVVHPRFRRLASHGFNALAFAWKRIEDLRKNRVSVSPELLQWSREDIPKVEAAWERTLSSIRGSRDFCRDQGIGFFLVYLGSDLEVKYAIDPQATIARLKAMGGPHEYISWNLGKSHKRVTAFCQENDILLVSLLEPLIAAQKATDHAVFGDHYTMFGHQVAARVLGSAMQARLQTHFAGNLDFKGCNSPECWEPETRPVAFQASGGAAKSP